MAHGVRCSCGSYEVSDAFYYDYEAEGELGHEVKVPIRKCQACGELAYEGKGVRTGRVLVLLDDEVMA